MLADFKYLLSLLCCFMPPGLRIHAQTEGQGIKRVVLVSCSPSCARSSASRCKQPGLGQPGRDGILCPFMSTMCSSWTLSQMSVIFHSFGLSPFSPSSSTGIFRRPEGLLLISSAFRFQGQYKAEENALTKNSKNQPVEVLLVSAQQDTTT